jgi:hypothetical protein
MALLGLEGALKHYYYYYVMLCCSKYPSAMGAAMHDLDADVLVRCLLNNPCHACMLE